MHFIFSADLSGYTIWVFGNSHTDQSQLVVCYRNWQEIEHASNWNGFR